nr:MAG TPA: Minor capsid protein from bacteriophage [Caudoviricetes sp.]
MADERKPIGKDASGYDVLTIAVKALLNQFPGLYENETVKFEELGEDSGIAFSADNGALIFSETEDVLGGVRQTCQYPFYIIYRTSSTKERQKMSIQEFLDTFGKWLCREPVVIDGSEQRLSNYPTLSQGRKITKVTRDNSYGLEPQESGVQDWILPVSIEYKYDFERW